MISVSEIAEWCAGWNHLFGRSKVVSGTVTGAHIIATMFAGGFAIAADRLTLRAHRRDRAARVSQLREVAAIHRPVLVGIAVLFVSGVLLALADVETFLPSPYFWVKLSLVALLLVNGVMLTMTERTLTARVVSRDSTSSDSASSDSASGDSASGETMLWSRIRMLAASSLVLWTATAVAGIVLSTAA